MTELEERLQRHTRMEQIRAPWDTLWDDIDTYVTNRRASWHAERRDNRGAIGAETGRFIYDSTAADAGMNLADMLQGNSASPYVDWFLPGIRDPQAMRLKVVRQYFEDLRDAVASYLTNSNFYEQVNEGYQDKVFHGITTVLGPFWDRGRKQLVYLARHPREVFIARDQYERISLWHREFHLTTVQIDEQFPGWRDKLDPKDRKKADTEPLATWCVVHIVEKRKIWDPTKVDTLNMPWRSEYVLKDEKISLRESGMKNPLITTAAWRMNSGDPYPRSPAIDAIFEIMGLNQAVRSKMRAVQLAVDPAWIATGDFTAEISIMPGSMLTAETGNDTMKALEMPLQYAAALDEIQHMQEVVRERFKNMLFLLMSSMDQRITATQTMEVRSEQLTVLGPIISRDQSELLVPLLNNTMQVLGEQKLLPDIPPILQEFMDKSVDITFSGPLAMAQKRLLQTQGLQQAMQAILPVGQIPQLASVYDNIDPDAYLTEAMTSYGGPPAIERDETQRDNMRKQRAEAQAKEQQLQQANVASQAAANVAKMPQQQQGQ